MSEAFSIVGGCLCGTLRYRAGSEPLYAGYCCCSDCRKASGPGYIGFLNFGPCALTFSGEVRTHTLERSDGRVSQRNFGPQCGALVFGGVIGNLRGHIIYAGSLDDPSHVKPTMAIFVRDKPGWVVLPKGLKLFDKMPV